MTLNINLDMDNDAFEVPRAELKRIFRELRDSMDDELLAYHDFKSHSYRKIIMDSNGNSIGTMTIEP